MMRTQGVVLRLLVVVWCWVAVGCAQQRGGGELSWMDQRRDFDSQSGDSPALDVRSFDAYEAAQWVPDPMPFWNEHFQTVDVPTIQPTPAPTLGDEGDPNPPAISGGTMAVSRDGSLIVVADSDRDRVWVVDPLSRSVLHEIELRDGDEPGRVVEDSVGTFHVVLRGSGEIASIKAGAGTVTRRRFACPAPRGIAYDDRLDALHVACVGGEFVTIPRGDGAVISRQLEGDLRDVVVGPSTIAVSVFRSARILFFDREMNRLGTFDPNQVARFPERINTAWRMIGEPTGAVVMSAQQSMSAVLRAEPGGYGAGNGAPICLGLINSVVLRVFGPPDHGMAPVLIGHSGRTPLPVDIVGTPNEYWVISAANWGQPLLDSGRAIGAFAQVSRVRSVPCERTEIVPARNHNITAGTLVNGRRVFFSREPAALLWEDGDKVVLIGARSVENTGHRIFHGNFNISTSMACASCHPEGRDDGLVWNLQFASFRTPSLRGTIADTAPYHWRGEFRSLATLVQDVFSARMAGPVLAVGHYERLQRWVEALPSISSEQPRDGQQQQAINRGAEVFRSDTAGCASCHSGPRFTNNQTMDVGTGGAFQVPSLVGVRFRAPYMHSGCAANIDARLSNMACGGRAHGGYGLSAQEKSDLAAYLGSI